MNKTVSIWGVFALIFGVSISSADNCGGVPQFALWNNSVTGNAPAGDLSLESIASQHNVRIERTPQNYGGCYSYYIIDSESGQALGEIPVSIRDQDPENYSPEELAQLSQRLGHMMQTDRSQLSELAQAKRKFLDDSGAMTDQTGINTDSLFDNLELSGNGVAIGFSGVECRLNGHYASPVPIEGSDVTIGHIEYRPDVTTYQSIYQTGQLTQSLRSSKEALSAIQARIQSNMRNVQSVMENPDLSSEIPEVVAETRRRHSCARNLADWRENIERPSEGLIGIIQGGPAGTPSLSTADEI